MNIDAYLQKKHNTASQSIFRNASPYHDAPSDDCRLEMEMPIPSSRMLPYLRKTRSDDSSVSSIASKRNGMFRTYFTPPDPSSRSRRFPGRRGGDPRMEHSNRHQTNQYSPSSQEMTIHDLTSAKEIIDSLSSSFSNLLSKFSLGGNLDETLASQDDVSILKDEDFVFVVNNLDDEIIDTRNEGEGGGMNSLPTRDFNTNIMVSQSGKLLPIQMWEERE